MKKTIFFLIIFTISLFAQFNGPKIVVEEFKFDFGVISEGTKATHKYVITNKGGADLTITKVKTSCGCTAAVPKNNTLAPFESTIIDVSFDSRRRSGKQKKNVYVFSNDPETPQLRLQFTANIIPRKIQKDVSGFPKLELSKFNHNFGDIKEGSVHDVNIKVFNRGEKELKIKKIITSCGCTAVMMKNKKLKPNEVGELKIKFDSDGLSGQIARTITLKTNDKKYPLRVITIIANVI
ncbi:MAG: DUF1573 domain-containing protein [Melioribacteraceae bacterium]